MTLRYWHSYILIHLYTLDILLVFLKNTVSEAFLFRSHSLSICSNMFPYTWHLGYRCWKYCMIKMNLFCYHILCHGCRCLTNHNSHKITLKLNKHTTMYFYKMTTEVIQGICAILTVSHIWSFICFPSIVIIRAPNSTPE